MYYLLKKINCMFHLFCIIVLIILINHKLQIESMLIRFCLLKCYSDGLNCKSKTGRMSLHAYIYKCFHSAWICCCQNEYESALHVQTLQSYSVFIHMFRQQPECYLYDHVQYEFAKVYLEDSNLSFKSNNVNVFSFDLTNQSHPSFGF